MNAINQILKNFQPAESRAAELKNESENFNSRDEIKICEQCQVGVEWRPHSDAAWRCATCDPPPEDFFAREVRMVVSLLDDFLTWHLVRPKPAKKNEVEIGEIPFEEIPPTTMDREMVEAYYAWMENCGVNRLTLDRVDAHNAKRKIK